jgi:septum formation protein
MGKQSSDLLVLGSGSSRRCEILSYFHIPFQIQVSPFDEDSIKDSGDPSKLVQEIAKGKACALDIDGHPVILTADTIVHMENRSYHKPKDAHEAALFLRALSGKWHTVYTGVSIRKGDTIFTESCSTKVLFAMLTDEQIAIYMHAFSTGDKAGGYAIQQGGCIAIERIEGCYYNVMGLPIQTTRNLLNRVGIDLWDSLKQH